MDKARLNEAIAVHLFGWRRAWRATGIYFEVPTCEGGDITVLEPHDWAGTWEGLGEMVEAMGKRGLYARVCFWPDGATTTDWCDAGLVVRGSAVASDAAEAAALAALRAVAREAARQVEA